MKTKLQIVRHLLDFPYFDAWRGRQCFQRPREGQRSPPDQNATISWHHSTMTTSYGWDAAQKEAVNLEAWHPTMTRSDFDNSGPFCGQIVVSWRFSTFDFRDGCLKQGGTCDDAGCVDSWRHLCFPAHTFLARLLKLVCLSCLFLCFPSVSWPRNG